MNKETLYLQCVSALLNSWVEKYNGTYYQGEYDVSKATPSVFIDIDRKTWDYLYTGCQNKTCITVFDIKPLVDIINNTVNKNKIMLNLDNNTWLFCGLIYPILSTNENKISGIRIRDLPYKLR